MVRIREIGEKLRHMKKDQFLILILAGVLMLVITLPVQKETSKETVEGTLQTGEGSQVLPPEQESYLTKLENKLETGLSCIEGVGRVRVLITLKSGGEQVILKDLNDKQASTVEKDMSGGSRTAIEKETAETTIYTDQSDGTVIPYVVETRVPEPEGVTVICEGADSAVVRENITEVVKALFPIEVHKIKVVRMAVTNRNSGKETIGR